MKICCGIVSFNPDIKRLRENISSIYKQLEIVLIFDNGSTNVSKIDSLLPDFNNVIVLKSKKNMGVAFALNSLCEKAISLGYSWILLLDQDSVAYLDIISVYSKYIFVKDVGIITCLIKDRNFEYNNGPIEGVISTVDNCITSGSMINLKIFAKLNGFDEKMFIDKVDTEYAFRLKLNNYSILRINKIEILHELGNHTKCKTIFGKKITLFNAPPSRVYYMVRNSVYLSRKYPTRKDSKAIRKAGLHRLLLIFLFEKNRFSKIKAGLKGYKDGKKIKIT